MRKRGLILNLIVLVVIVIIVLLILFIPKRTEDKSRNEKECLFDEDCVKTQVTCCPCNSGGIEKCIPFSELEEYKKNITKCPDNLICAQVFNCNIESCKCQDGKCTEITKID